MKKIILIGVVTGVSLLLANEPSVYGAGNIDSSSPYGLTTTEQNVLNNRKQVQKLLNQVSEHQSRIAGLTTVVDGLNNQVLDLKEQLKESRKAESKRDEASAKLEEDYKKSYTLLLELGKMIDQINNNYLTKNDLSIFQNDNSNNMIIDGRSYTDTTQQPENQHYGLDISDIYREGVELFSHKSYFAAADKFRQSIAQNYKLAPSSYYLGEIAYFTNDYYSAISYYKKSASIYDKASYMKILYLHTALSLSKTGQHDQARGFFKYVLDNYPGTKSAEIAQNNL